MGEQDRGNANMQALVVGGSGMLHGTCLALTEAGWDVAVVGRDKARIDHMAREASNHRGSIVPITCDYEDLPCYEQCLGRHVETAPPVRLVVSWIHGGAEQALIRTVEIVGRKPLAARTLLEVRASSVDGPGEHSPTALPVGPEWVRRHATLGFRVEHDGRQRWLTDREIADGITQAMTAAERDLVIGNMRPWSVKDQS